MQGAAHTLPERQLLAEDRRTNENQNASQRGTTDNAEREPVFTFTRFFKHRVGYLRRVQGVAALQVRLRFFRCRELKNLQAREKYEATA